MKPNSVFIILRNNSFICKKPDDKCSHVFKLDDIENIPNVPFYHHIWNDSAKYVKLYKNFDKNELMNNSLMSGLIKSHIYLAIPDDALEVDSRMIQEFLMKCGSKIVNVTPECMLVSRQDDTYVAVSFTCRMIILSYIKAGNIAHQQYLERNDYSFDELKGHISKLLYNQEIGKLPVYLNGEIKDQYSQLGCFVDPESILENYIFTERRTSRP